MKNANFRFKIADMDEYKEQSTKKSSTPKKKKKKFGIKNMGINIDKNEYMEIILSNSNHPESTYNRLKDSF